MLNGHDHLYARYAPIRPYFDAPTFLSPVSPAPGSGIPIPSGASGNSSWAPAARHSIPSSQPHHPPIHRLATRTSTQQILQAATGNYWGVMALTLGEHGYQWDFESALELLGTLRHCYSYTDKGSASCHGGRNW